jgi:hypothetical protein
VKCGDTGLRLYGYFIASVICFACPSFSSVYQCLSRVFRYDATIGILHAIVCHVLQTSFFSFAVTMSSRYRPIVAQRVPGGLGSQIFMTFGT